MRLQFFLRPGPALPQSPGDLVTPFVDSRRALQTLVQATAANTTMRAYAHPLQLRLWLPSLSQHEVTIQPDRLASNQVHLPTSGNQVGCLNEARTHLHVFHAEYGVAVSCPLTPAQQEDMTYILGTYGYMAHHAAVTARPDPRLHPQPQVSAHDLLPVLDFNRPAGDHNVVAAYRQLSAYLTQPMYRHQPFIVKAGPYHRLAVSLSEAKLLRATDLFKFAWVDVDGQPMLELPSHLQALARLEASIALTDLLIQAKASARSRRAQFQNLVQATQRTAPLRAGLVRVQPWPTLPRPVSQYLTDFDPGQTLRVHPDNLANCLQVLRQRGYHFELYQGLVDHLYVAHGPDVGQTRAYPHTAARVPLVVAARDAENWRTLSVTVTELNQFKACLRLHGYTQSLDQRQGGPYAHQLLPLLDFDRGDRAANVRFVTAQATDDTDDDVVNAHLSHPLYDQQLFLVKSNGWTRLAITTSPIYLYNEPGAVLTLAPHSYFDLIQLDEPGAVLTLAPNFLPSGVTSRFVGFSRALDTAFDQVSALATKIREAGFGRRQAPAQEGARSASILQPANQLAENDTLAGTSALQDPNVFTMNPQGGVDTPPTGPAAEAMEDELNRQAQAAFQAELRTSMASARQGAQAELQANPASLRDAAPATLRAAGAASAQNQLAASPFRAVGTRSGRLRGTGRGNVQEQASNDSEDQVLVRVPAAAEDTVGERCIWVAPDGDLRVLPRVVYPWVHQHYPPGSYVTFRGKTWRRLAVEEDTQMPPVFGRGWKLEGQAIYVSCWRQQRAYGAGEVVLLATTGRLWRALVNVPAGVVLQGASAYWEPVYLKETQQVYWVSLAAVNTAGLNRAADPGAGLGRRFAGDVNWVTLAIPYDLSDPRDIRTLQGELFEAYGDQAVIMNWRKLASAPVFGRVQEQAIAAPAHPARPAEVVSPQEET